MKTPSVYRKFLPTHPTVPVIYFIKYLIVYLKELYVQLGIDLFLSI